MSQRSIPRHALSFSLPVTFESGTGSRRFSSVAYGGGVIHDHWLSPCAFDMETLSIEPPLPVLSNHDPDKSVGVCDMATRAEALQVEGQLFSDIDDEARMIADKADRGMPWGMSVGLGNGVRLVEIPEGVEATLNGKTVTGPLNILFNARVREVSFCPVAADGSTSARIFSGDEAVTIEVETMNETKPAELDSLKETVADLQAKFAATTDALAQYKAKAEEAEARAALAEKTLQEQRVTARVKAVKALFAAQGRDFVESEAIPYVELTDAQFEAISADIKKLAERRDLPDGLFASFTGSETGSNTLAELHRKALKQVAGGN